VQRAIFDREAPSFAAAVASTINAIESSIPGARVLAVKRLDRAAAAPFAALCLMTARNHPWHAAEAEQPPPVLPTPRTAARRSPTMQTPALPGNRISSRSRCSRQP
jgi:hypothetical protein